MNQSQKSRVFGPLLGLGLLLGLAQASSYKTVSLLEQLTKADSIVHATIASVRSEERNGKPWTVYNLTIKKSFKAELAGSNFAILGGELNNKTYRLVGAPSFKRDDEVFLFLYTKRFDSPIVGFNQGIYKVQGERVVDANGSQFPLVVDGAQVASDTTTFSKFIERTLANPPTPVTPATTPITTPVGGGSK
jgi:hypothetical protein